LLLSRPDLIKEIRLGRLRFSPEVAPESIEQVSIDLRLGRGFTRFKKPAGWLSAIRLDPSIWESQDLWEHTERDSYTLEPGQFVLAQTLEKVHIPGHLAGFIEGRSSSARVGLTTHLTAPKIDPGFEGTITLEMANLGNLPIELRAGVDKPAQLMLFRLTRPLAKSDRYGAGPGHLFQHQSKPTPRKPRR